MVILVAGSVTILAGTVMLVAPGPGMLVIYAGFGILATEFIWAKQTFKWIGDKAKQLWARLRVWFKQMWRREK